MKWLRARIRAGLLQISTEVNLLGGALGKPALSPYMSPLTIWELTSPACCKETRRHTHKVLGILKNRFSVTISLLGRSP